ncbi:hypothetical protein SteCoe_15548 [Stentor coeruleus]|uniref:C2 NT-type domain-containing protein n=1 Tax=Stentor coeruleus TaxID=5963 RepID=A0A1R2C3D2_9CILI|nr:hypothetical protein SteCoe_15548 [Stentor coeruleus]
MAFLKRLGTKKTLFSVDITIHSIKLSLSIEAGISIIWKRKKKRIETSSNHILSPELGVLEINETLTMINTMYQEKSGNYVKKIAELTIQAHIDKKGKKKLGKVKIDLASIGESSDHQSYPIIDCIDKKANISASIKFTPIGEATIVDTISEISKYSGVSMGTNGDYSGPLFHENSFEAEPNNSPLLKPPKTSRFRQQREKSQEISVSFDNIALIKILQKENNQIKAEKEEVKFQLELVSKRTAEERNKYCDYVSILEKELDELKPSYNKLQNKNERFREKNKELKSRIDEISLEIEEYKVRYNHAEKKKLKDEIKTLRIQVKEVENEKNKALMHAEEVLDAKKQIEVYFNNLKDINAKLTKDLENTRDELINNCEQNLEQSTPQANFKKKTQESINILKRELKEAQEENEDLREQQTELITQLQQSKITHGNAEEVLKDQIRKLENELSDKKEEIIEINIRLEEEILNSRKFERKTITTKEETEEKVTKLNQNLKELNSEKNLLEASYISFQRKLDTNRTAIDPSIIAKLEGTIVSNQKEIIKLNGYIKEKDKIINDIKTAKERLENENSLLNEHLNGVKISEFSDPAVTALNDQIDYLEKKISEIESSYDEERSELLNQISILEKELEILEENKKEVILSFENKINSLNVENKLISERVTEPRASTSQKFVNSMNEENYKQKIELLKIQILESKNYANKLSDEVKINEQKYMESKLLMSKKNLEKENMQIKYREAQEQLREYSAQYTILEVELYKINERFGQSLNRNIELENEIQDIKEQVYSLLGQKKT